MNLEKIKVVGRAPGRMSPVDDLHLSHEKLSQTLVNFKINHQLHIICLKSLLLMLRAINHYALIKCEVFCSILHAQSHSPLIPREAGGVIICCCGLSMIWLQDSCRI